ncbi:MAG: hypothetical protein AAB309_01720 [Deltaproteobacteria bacterium]
MKLKGKIEPRKLSESQLYGYFNEQHEFVITCPDTPKPWINYLSNAAYHALVSQTGGGYSYYKDSKLHRILHWEDHRSDRPGRYLFIKDQKSGEIWAPNWQPFRVNLKAWQAVHGFGYTSIHAVQNGIETEITYFVPPKDPCEIWIVKMKNKSGDLRDLTVFPFVQWLLGDFYLEADHKNIMLLYNEGYFDPSLQAIVAYKHRSSCRKQETYGFFAPSEAPTGYELSYENFVGRYGQVTNPELIRSGKCSNQPIHGESMVGVFEIPVSLHADEEKTFVFVLGFTEKKKEIPQIIKRCVKSELASELLLQTKECWRKKLGTIQVTTPDSHFDRMTNQWGKYQLLQITRWRSASFYAPGEGGRGYRDTAQDVEGVCSIDPGLAKEWIEKLLRYQYQSGHAVAGFSEVDGPWEIGSNTGILGKSDVAAWIPFMVSTYLKETGDRAFLNEKIPFLDGDQATVWGHCVRAMDHFWKQRGTRGLPLFWKADWNDAFDQCGIKGKGESVWLAQAYARALLKTEELAQYLGDKHAAEIMRTRYEEMKREINAKGWDGDWYISIFTDDGRAIGSHRCHEGKIYLNTQSWAILSQVAPELRAARCLKSVEKYLETPIGPALFSPAYQKYDPGLGRISAFAPGTKENAAVFSHAAAFLIVAYAMRKEGEKAYELFSKIAPYNPVKTAERYQTEPYVYAEYCYGPSNRQFGLGAFSWNTGTTPWMFMAATQWIIGVHPTFDGLKIDPVVPGSWKEFSITRPFRGAIYKVHFKNPKGVQSGVKQIVVNGEKISGNTILVLAAGKEHLVEVEMG